MIKRSFPFVFLEVDATSFRPWEFAVLAWRTRTLKVRKQEDGSYHVNLFGSELKMRLYLAASVASEIEIWNKYYLPVSVHGKIVLDAGAGNGETALFYLRHGAKRVVAVEKDPTNFRLLQENTRNLGVEPIFDSFNISQTEGVDFMKVDVEGGEACLLKLERLPCASVIETHSRPLEQQFIEKFGMKMACRMTPEIAILVYVPDRMR